MDNGHKSHIRNILFRLKNDERLTHEEQIALRDLDDVWLHELIVVESMYYAAYNRQQSDRPRNELAAELFRGEVKEIHLGRLLTPGFTNEARQDATITIKGCLELADMFLKLSGQKNTYPEPPEDNEQNR